MAEANLIRANGLRLHYLDSGDPSHPAVVCVHGLTGNAHNFDQVGRMLASNFRVIALDVRGRGDSDWAPPFEYTFPNYVNDLAATLDALALRRTSLIGTSMGGIISILFAASFPDRVERLVLNDIGPEVDRTGLTRIAGYVGEAPAEFKDLSEVARYYRETYPPAASMPEALLVEWVKWTVKPTANGRLTWKMDPAIRSGMRGEQARNAAPDLWQPYSKIKAPVLIIRGAQSDILSPATAAKMCATTPAARLVEVPSVGHAPTLSEPAALKALQEFFRP